MIKFEYIPNNDFYTPVKLEVDLTNDSTIDEQFEAWKKFMYAMTFTGINKYNLEIEDETI